MSVRVVFQDIVCKDQLHVFNVMILLTVFLVIQLLQHVINAYMDISQINMYALLVE